MSSMRSSRSSDNRAMANVCAKYSAVRPPGIRKALPSWGCGTSVIGDSAVTTKATARPATSGTASVAESKKGPTSASESRLVYC